MAAATSLPCHRMFFPLPWPALWLPGKERTRVVRRVWMRREGARAAFLATVEEGGGRGRKIKGKEGANDLKKRDCGNALISCILWWSRKSNGLPKRVAVLMVGGTE